jgi:hypothetical protein
MRQCTAQEATFSQNVTWTFVRLLRFLSGPFGHNDACRGDERGFDKITRSGGATTDKLPAPQRNAWFIDV